MKYIICIILLLLQFVPNSHSLVTSDLTNVLTLTSNFFSSLNSFGDELDEETQHLIDNQIDHYVDLVTRTHGLVPKSKSRRSIFNEDIDVLSTDFIGVYVLNGFFEQTRIPVKNPIDIALFKHDFGSTEIWYAATLQSSNIKSNEAERLFLYRYEDEDYIQISNVSIAKGTKISAHAFHGIIYIVVADNSSKSKATIFIFDIEENLYKIQTLDIAHPSDITIWEQNNEIYLAIIQETLNTENGTYYEIDSPIFKWIGKNFEYVQNINTSGGRKITSFAIGDDQYLAIANHRNDNGETEIFSEIFKYDAHDEKFKSYQQILTHAAVDIQYFCFKQNNYQESFIVVANSYELDTEGNLNYETSSIVYKYVEDYFMPFQSFTLNYAEQWLPVVGPNGEFILLVSLKNDGAKAFQYDGWRFVESEVQYTGEAFGTGIRSFRSYLYNTQPTIVVANKNDRGNMLNVFSPTFKYQNVMNEFQMDMHEWCQQLVKEIDIDELKELNRQVEEAPKVDDLEIQLNGKIFFHNVTIYNLVIDDENVNTRRVKKSNEVLYLEKQIDKRSEQLKDLDSRLQNNSEPIILNGDVRLKSLEVSNDDRIIFEDLETTAINKIKLEEFFNDIINLNDPFSLHDGMEFEDVIFDGLISPKLINNMPKHTLLHTTSNLTLNNNLIVHGNVIIEDLMLGGYLNGINFNENNILLTEGDQILEGNLLVSSIETENLSVKYINNMDMINLEPNRVVNITEHNIDTLTVKNVTVNKINEMNMNIFHKIVLRTRGDQEIISNYEFETLIVDDFEVDDLLSGTHISTLALISDRTNLLEQSLIFTKDLETKYLHVITSLNQIPVYNGKLDVLLKDNSRIQHISGSKKFESINLSGPIQLRGQIKIKGLDPPFITRNLTLSGDYKINGDAIIEKFFMFGDLAEPSGSYSMERLEKQGLKLTDTEIPNHLSFNHGLNVDEIEVDTINDVNVNSWIIFENDPPEITGTKIFDDQLNINGELTVLAINGKNLKLLYDNILRIDSFQTIVGHHSYSNISCIRVVSNSTFINNIPWENVMVLNEDQYINGTTILSEPVKMSQFKGDFVEVKGKIKNYNFDEMIADTAFNDTINIITGKKYFEEKIVFKNLNVDYINNASLHKLLSEINQWIGDVHIEGPIKIKNLEVNNIFFDDDINGIKDEDFGSIWLLKEGRQIIYEDQIFETVICKQSLNIKSEKINDIHLPEIDNLAIKTYETHHFKSIQLANGVESKQSITVGGKVKSIDISEAVLTKDLNNQTIHGNQIIFNNLTVHGYLHVKGLLSGINLTLLAILTDPINDRKEIKLIIDGNINFKHEFNVNHLNDIDIEKLANNAWFTDQPTDVKGFISFENVVFEDELKVDGLVNDIPFVWLSNNYFSKSKDQNISARLDFVDGILFGKDIEAQRALVNGLVATIRIEEFNKYILRNDDQTFNFDIKFDNAEIISEFDAKLINNLNLNTDVMRNDISENIVTGRKNIRNMNAVNLEILEGKLIQNVDVDDWIKNAVLLNGTFKIDGLKFIKNAKFEKNIDLQGLLNSHLFNEEHVMTTNTKQKITGKKDFVTSGYLINSSLTFDTLKLKGLYNDIETEKLIQSQIDKSKEIIPISALKNFYNTLAASNINIDYLYQGIDIKELIKNITNLDKLDNRAEEYNRLINFAKNILVVLKQQSHFLDTYIQIQKIGTDAQDIINLQDDEKEFLALVTKQKHSTIISVFSWDAKLNQFTEFKEIPITTKKEITFMSQISLNNKNYLYLEQQSDSIPGFTHLGTMYEILASGSDTNLLYTPANKTNSILSIILPNENKNCLLNMQNNNYANIFCDNNKNTFDLYQQIDAVDGASTITVNNIPYIFIINSGNNSTVKIWKYDTKNVIFQLHQIFTISVPSSIDSIYYNNDYYLAVGLKHITETENPGSVIIYKYDETEDKFKEWHEISVIDPTNVKFGILSSEELVLHVLNNSPVDSLAVYLYEGVSGFKKKFVTSAIPVVNTVSNFLTNNIDFIVVSNKKEVRIIKALYKGKKYK